ncbi:MAG: exodeoxyribonuclease VII small subunit [Bacteroidia bacterium]|nr:exodeoxyribonuclease VII small subunit [Bacteroidia bacterium]
MELPDTFSYEQTKQRIEHILEQLQTGGLSLDENLRLFEEGSRLIRDCELWLAQAQLKVKKVIQTQEGIQLEDFEP